VILISTCARAKKNDKRRAKFPIRIKFWHAREMSPKIYHPYGQMDKWTNGRTDGHAWGVEKLEGTGYFG